MVAEAELSALTDEDLAALEELTKLDWKGVDALPEVGELVDAFVEENDGVDASQVQRQVLLKLDHMQLAEDVRASGLFEDAQLAEFDALASEAKQTGMLRTWIARTIRRPLVKSADDGGLVGRGLQIAALPNGRVRFRLDLLRQGERARGGVSESSWAAAKEAPATAPPSSGDEQRTADADERRHPKGTLVNVVGLKSKPELNGLGGT
eukprot:1085137-Prymnesium_polylepis.1